MYFVWRHSLSLSITGENLYLCFPSVDAGLLECHQSTAPNTHDNKYFCLFVVVFFYFFTLLFAHDSSVLFPLAISIQCTGVCVCVCVLQRENERQKHQLPSWCYLCVCTRVCTLNSLGLPSMLCSYYRLNNCGSICEPWWCADFKEHKESGAGFLLQKSASLFTLNVPQLHVFFFFTISFFVKHSFKLSSKYHRI